MVSRYNELTNKIISAAIEVHRNLGPGLLESVYECCLLEELRERNLFVESQVKVPLLYKGKKLDKEFLWIFLLKKK